MSENGKEKGDLPRDSVFRFLFSEKNMGLTFILILQLVFLIYIYFSLFTFRCGNIPAIQRKIIHLENSRKENLHMEYIPTTKRPRSRRTDKNCVER